MSRASAMSAASAPSLEAIESGWSPLDALAGVGLTRSFVSGDADGDRLRVRYFRRADDGALVGRAWFGAGAEGPPGHAHGGAMAALLDEAMGASAWLAGHAVLAAQITIAFRAILPLGSIVTVEASIARIDGRKVITRGRLVGDAGVTHAEGEGLFVELDAARISNLAKGTSGQGPR